MPKYYPNAITGKVIKSSEYWGVDKRKLEKQGYITDFFKGHQYNGQMYYILRKKVGPYYRFTKITRKGTKYKLPTLLANGWEIVIEPKETEKDNE